MHFNVFRHVSILTHPCGSADMHVSLMAEELGCAGAWWEAAAVRGGSLIHPAALLIHHVLLPLQPANHRLIRQMGSSTAVTLQAPLRYEWVLRGQSLPFK